MLAIVTSVCLLCRRVSADSDSEARRRMRPSAITGLGGRASVPRAMMHSSSGSGAQRSGSS